MGKSDTANIRQVAAIAGVSIATVSRALQHPELVRAETREKVLAAVRQTNFVSNAQARSFRQQATRTVIVLVRDIGNPFYLEIFKGIDEVAQEAGYRVLLGDARDDEAQVQHHVEMVRQKQADGLILMIGHFPVELADQIEMLPPIVIASEAFPGLALPTVKVDNIEASRQAVEFLVSQGHRRIAHIAGPLPEQLALERLEGYRLGLRQAGLHYSDKLVVPGDYSIEAGRSAVRSLFDANVPLSAIFASSDQMAIGAISELRRRGHSVPADYSVIGFDDIILADAVEPPLTTMRQPRRDIGRHAMTMMIERLNGNAEVRTIELATELVVRQSVSPPKQ